jgi:hypothetical protein
MSTRREVELATRRLLLKGKKKVSHEGASAAWSAEPVAKHGAQTCGLKNVPEAKRYYLIEAQIPTTARWAANGNTP